MSTPRYDWWPYVKGMIRRYPELCRREADLHTTAVTPNYGGTPGVHGGHTDPVAKAALRSLPEINRIAVYVEWHTRPSPQEAARDRLFQLSMPMWVENGRAFHE